MKEIASVFPSPFPLEPLAFAPTSCCPKPFSLLQLLCHLIPSCHRQISPLSGLHLLPPFLQRPFFLF